MAFIPKLNSALKRIIECQRDENGKLVSDGTLTVHKKNRGAEGDAGEADDDAGPTFYAILDRTERSCPHDTLEISVPTRVSITGDLVCYNTHVCWERRVWTKPTVFGAS